jgi:hypothetical protein
MHKVSYAIFALPLLLLASMAQAQSAGTITFTANRTSATGSLTPILTWSTTPVASSCTASGAWSGTKFASGSETLASITSNKSYTLTCSWGNGTATVAWTKPTKNSDGSTLTDLAGFKVVYGNSASALSLSKSITGATATSTSLGSLGAGTWYFAVRAVNSKGVESANSSVGSKTITAATAARTVAITISSGSTPAPSPTPTPTGLRTAATIVYDVVMVDGQRERGRQVGTIALGKPCDSSYKAGSVYYKVSASDVTQIRTPRSNTVVSKCTKS